MPESDDFDALIQEFINDSLNDNTISWSEFTHKGKNYIQPMTDFASSKESLPPLADAYAVWREQNHSLLQGGIRLFTEPAEAGKDISLEINLILLTSIADYNRPTVTFALYREGTGQPIVWSTETEYNAYRLYAVLTASASDMPAGKYLLAISGLTAADGIDEYIEQNDGRILFPLQLLPDGAQLAKPSLETIQGSRPSFLISEGCCTSGLLQMKLRFAGLLPANSELKVMCYTDSFYLMGSAERFITSGSRRELSLHLDSEEVWMPGRYFAVFSLNGEPFYKASFTYQDGQPDNWVLAPLTPADVEYGVVKHLETRNGSEWIVTRNSVGMQHLCRSLAQRALRSGFNKHCCKQDLSLLRRHVFVTIEAQKLSNSGKLAYCLPQLWEFGTSAFKSVDCEEWINEPEEGMMLLDDRADTTVVFTNIEALLQPELEALLRDWTEAAHQQYPFFAWILCGTTAQVDALFDRYPELAALFAPDNRLVMQDPTAEDAIHEVLKTLLINEIHLSPAAEHTLAQQLITHYTPKVARGEADLRNFAIEYLINRLKQRLHNDFNPSKPYTQQEMTTIEASDIDFPGYLAEVEAKAHKENGDSQPAQQSPAAHTTKAANNERQTSFEASMTQLHAMVGLTSLKTQLADTCYQVQFEAMRQQLGLPSSDDGRHHMLFTGNPGTGKTTVARLMGKIYHAMGVLSTDEVICTERTQLLGKYIGYTEDHMKELLENARGKVLFIDEAYTLCDSLDDRKDYGNHVIESLLTVLAEPHPDMLVILVGYENEMKRLMQMNQGLRDRFPHKFHFDDFSTAELMQIADNQLAEQQYEWHPAARQLTEDYVTEVVARKDAHFGNARWMKQFIGTGIIPAMARRVMQSGEPITPDHCRIIEKADVEVAIARHRAEQQAVSPQVPIRRRIGFTA